MATLHELCCVVAYVVCVSLNGNPALFGTERQTFIDASQEAAVQILTNLQITVDHGNLYANNANGQTTISAFHKVV